MIQSVSPDAEIGVIIGRFQVHQLHTGHRELIDHVTACHQKAAILLGSTPGVLVTRRNPLDFQSRKAMIQASYPDIVVLPIKDQPTDEGWSRSLDRVLADAFEIGNAVLYGSRDSFVPSYSGRWPVVELEAARYSTGTEVRRSVSHAVRASAEFRHGVVYASHNRHPVAFPTVDVALLKCDADPDGADLALGRKVTDAPGLWRFPGGFVDPHQDRSLEAAAARELHEEMGQAPGEDTFRFIGSTRVDDWRYRNEEDKIMTSLFYVSHAFGPLIPGDDLDEAAWFSIRRLPDVVLPQHRPLAAMLRSYLKKRMK